MRRITAFIAAIILTLSCFAFTAYAAKGEVPYLQDKADVLTDDEEAQILSSLSSASVLSDADVVILTINNTGDKESADYAKEYYKESGFDMNNGVILLFVLETGRTVQIVTFGDMKQTAPAQNIIDEIMPVLNSEGYAAGFNALASFIAKSSSNFVPYEKAEIPSERLKPRLIDAAGVIPDEDEAELLALLEEKSEETKLDIAVLTVTTTGGKTPEAYADDYYDYNGFGYGEERDGVLLLISFDPRYVHISTCGKGIKVIKNDDIDSVIDTFYTELKAEKYTDVTKLFVSAVADEASKYRMAPVTLAFVGLVIGLIISSIIVKSMKNKNISVRSKAAATEYVIPGSLVLNSQNDTFLYRNVSKTAIPKESSSGSSGGTHTSSSGTSHGGGGRSF